MLVCNQMEKCRYSGDMQFSGSLADSTMVKRKIYMAAKTDICSYTEPSDLSRHSLAMEAAFCNAITT